MQRRSPEGITRFISVAQLARHLLLFVLIALFVSSSISRTANAADGDLDLTFGNGGIVSTDFSGSGARVYALAKQTDSKIIAAGYSSIGVEEGTGNRIFYDFALTRYHFNGTLDTTFGAGGKVTTHFLEGLNIAAAVAVQPDGKIIAVGSALTYGSKSDAALARYNPDGSLDTSFGSGGKILLDFFGSSDGASAIIIKPDGKIVIAGSAANGAYSDFAVVRFNIDGSLDTNFGTGGKVITPFGPDNDYASSISVQADGKMVVGGGAFSQDTSQDFALARYNSDGSLDMSFGSGGKVRTDFFISPDIGQDVEIQPDGKILLSGWVYRSLLQYDYSIARYHTDGSLDTSFGTGGKVSTNFLISNFVLGSQDIANAIAVLPNGKILVVGQVGPIFPPSVFGLARYNNNGTLDSSFGSGGLVTTTIGRSYADAQAVLLQNDGKFIVAGSSLQHHSDPFANRLDFTLVRYLNTNFDVCLQDESNSNLLQLNSATGEYQFTNCSGFTLGGTGTLTKRGSAITLQHNSSDRRVMVSIDTSSKRATASLQVFSQGRTFNITDRNILNNTCVCN